jgi:hypothetical protein
MLLDEQPVVNSAGLRSPGGGHGAALTGLGTLHSRPSARISSS